MRSERRVVELRGIEEAPVHRRHDLAARERVHRRAQPRKHVDREAHGAELEPLKIVGLGDRLFEPAERLSWHRAVGKRHDVGADGGVKFVEQLLPAAVLVPGEHRVGIHAVARPRPPECDRRLLAVVVYDHAVTTVEGSLGNRIQKAEGGHHRARGQHLDLQVSAGHVVDLLCEVVGILMEDVFLRPRALPAHRDRPRLPASDHRETQNRRATCGHSRFENVTSRDLFGLFSFGFVLLDHGPYPFFIVYWHAQSRQPTIYTLGLINVNCF